MINRSSYPPGGWQFYQPETKWSPKDALNYGFYDMAQLIHQHRIANNISSTVDQAISDLEAYTRARFPQIAAIPSTTNAQPRVSGCRSCGR